MPESQKRAVAAEGEVLLLRGKLQEAEQRAQEAERRATAVERERDVLRAQARKPKPKPGQQQEVGRAEGGGGATAWGGVSDGVKYLMAGSQAWKSLAEKVRGELSAVAATARPLLGQKEGGGLSFELVVPGYKTALHSHEAVEKRYPGDALVEAATSPALLPPAPAEAQGSGSSIGTASQ